MMPSGVSTEKQGPALDHWQRQARDMAEAMHLSNRNILTTSCDMAKVHHFPKEFGHSSYKVPLRFSSESRLLTTSLSS